MGEEHVIVYTMAGQIVGARHHTLNEDEIALRRPCSLAFAGQNVQMTPLTVLADGDVFTINKSTLLFKEAYPVAKEIRDKYIEITTGIQLAPAGAMNT